MINVKTHVTCCKNETLTSRHKVVWNAKKLAKSRKMKITVMCIVPLNHVELASLHIMPKGGEAILYIWGGMVVQSYLLDKWVGHFWSAIWNFLLLPSFQIQRPQEPLYTEFQSYVNLFDFWPAFWAFQNTHGTQSRVQCITWE